MTENHFGAGEAYFIASENEASFLEDFFSELFGRLKLVSGFCAKLPDGVTVTGRWKPQKADEGGQEESERTAVWFLQNFRAEEMKVELEKSYVDVESEEQVNGLIFIKPYMCRIFEG